MLATLCIVGPNVPDSVDSCLELAPSIDTPTPTGGGSVGIVGGAKAIMSGSSVPVASVEACG